MVSIQAESGIELGHRLRHTIDTGVYRSQRKVRIRPTWRPRDGGLKLRRRALPVSSLEQREAKLIVSQPGVWKHLHRLLQRSKCGSIIFQTRLRDSKLHSSDGHIR